MSEETCEGCTWEKGVVDSDGYTECAKRPGLISKWAGGSYDRRCDDYKLNPRTTTKPPDGATCADCEHCPPKPTDGRPAICHRYREVGGQDYDWAAWHTGGTPASVPRKTKCFTPKDTSALPDGQCCGKCKKWGKMEQYADAGFCPIGTHPSYTETEYGRDCQDFAAKDTPTLCNTCVHAPEGLSDDVSTWGDARCGNGESNYHGCTLRHELDDDTQGKACEDHKPRPTPPATAAEPEDPPLPDPDKLDAKGYELVGEIREPVFGKDAWVYVDDNGAYSFYSSDRYPLKLRDKKGYGKRRHILHKKPQPLDPPMPAKMPDGFEYVRCGEPVPGTDIWLTPTTHQIRGDRDGCSLFPDPKYGTRRRIVRRKPAEEVLPTYPLPTEKQLADLGYKDSGEFRDPQKGEAYAGKQDGRWTGYVCIARGMNTTWDGGRHILLPIATPPPYEPVEGQCCGVCSKWNKSREHRVAGRCKVDQALRSEFWGGTCQRFTAKPTPAGEGKTCGTCAGHKSNNPKGGACICDPEYPARAECYRPARSTPAPQTCLECDHCPDKPTPYTFCPHDKTGATRRVMNLDHEGFEACKYFTPKTTSTDTHETPAGKDATMTDMPNELMDFTRKPKCQACGSIAFFDPCTINAGAVPGRPRHLARKCKFCGVIAQMKWACDSSPIKAVPGSSRITRALWWTALLPYAIVRRGTVPFLKWTNPTPLHTLGWAGLTAMAINDPDRAWNFAHNLLRLIGLVG